MGYYKFSGEYISSGGSGFAYVTDLPNLCDPSKCSPNAKNGAIMESDYIRCTPGKILSAGYISKYVYNPNIIADWREYALGVYFYDENKVQTDSLKLTRQENAATGIVIPTGATYVRCAWAYYGGSDYFRPTEQPEKCYVTIGDHVPTNPLPYDKGRSYTVELDDNAFYGKTLCVFGDSYSDSWGGHSWDAVTVTAANQGGTAENNTPWTGKKFWSKVCSELGMTLDNRAKGGSNLCRGSSSYESYNGIDRLDELVSEVQGGKTAPDYIVIQYGTNAWESQITTAADTSLSSYSGGLKYFIDTIHTAMPQTKICVMLPLLVADYPHRFNAHDLMLETLQLDGYNVPYVDMAAISGIVKADLPDGLHPASLKANTAYARGARTALMMAE